MNTPSVSMDLLLQNHEVLIKLLEDNNRYQVEIVQTLNAFSKRLDKVEKNVSTMQRYLDSVVETQVSQCEALDEMQDRVDVLDDNIHIVDQDLENYIHEDKEIDKNRTKILNRNVKATENSLRELAKRIVFLEKNFLIAL